MKGQCLSYVKVPKMFLYVCFFIQDRVFTFTSTEIIRYGLIGSHLLVENL